MQNYNFQKETNLNDEQGRLVRSAKRPKRTLEKDPTDPDQDDYERTDTAEYARRQYLLKQTALASYLPPSLQSADRKEQEMFSRFAATWISNTATGAAVALNRYLVGDLQLAAAQGQTSTVFEVFFQTKPTDPKNLAVLHSRLNLLQKVRNLHGIKGAQYHLEQLSPLPQNLAERVESMVNHAQNELEQHPQMLHTFTRTIADINEKMQKRETTELLRSVEGEADRRRYPNGQAIYQQIQRLQQSEQAQNIREESQYIELIQTRNNFQSWCLEKTGGYSTNLQNHPREEDLNYDLKVSIADFLYKKLHPQAENLRTHRQDNSPEGIKLEDLRRMPDEEFLRGLDWQTQGKAIHPNPKQIQMMREALISAATALNSKQETHLDDFLNIGEKNSSNSKQPYESRAMKILWIAGAEAPCKLGVFKAANRKLHSDLHLAFEGNVLERLIHFIKANFRWFAQLQQLVMINRQLASIHRDMNPTGAAHQEQHTTALRNMPRL